MDYFELNFLDSPLILASAGVAIFAALWLLIIYCPRIARIPRFGRHCNEEAEKAFSPALPPLSIVVYCKDSSEALARLLPEIFKQEYPASIEVIVTTDGRSLHAENVVSQMVVPHERLRMTYVPDEAHALSRRKLAMTLGVKAARYNHIVMTDARVLPSSSRWLASIARNFADGKQVVLGYCNLADNESAPESGFAAFDSLADAVTYLSSAIVGNPYRGNECNLAFNKRLFFENHGFARAVGLHYGIDDIFISQIANADNCAVEICADSVVTRRCDSVGERHLTDKLNHAFTGKMTSRFSRRVMGFSSLMMWVWLGATVATGLLAWPALIPLIAAAVLGLAWLIAATILWRKAGRVLGVRVSGPTIPLFMFIRPIYNYICRMKSRSTVASNFTWNKDRY